MARLKAQGLTYQEIGEKLDITEGTARANLRRVRNKLGVKTTDEALRLVAERGELGDTEAELRLLADAADQARAHSAADVRELAATT